MKQKISEAVTKEMTEQNISFSKLSNKAGISKTIIQSVKNQEGYTIDSLIKILKELGLSLVIKK